MRRARWARAATAACALAGVLVVAPAAQAAKPRHVVPGAYPGWAHGAKSQGHATGQVTARVFLQPRGGLDALKADVTQRATPGSSSYHQWLSPDSYRARYEPTSATVDAVQSWLRGSGMTVSAVGPDRRYVVATGSTAAAEKAFGTTLRRFRHNGRTVRAPADSVTVPSSVGEHVLAVGGLDTTPYHAKPQAKQPPAFVNARPCSQYYGQLTAKTQADFKTPLPPFNGTFLPYAPCGYTPSQLRGAYEGATTRTGQGVTVAIVDAYASPSILQDANQYATQHGDPAFRANQFTQTVPGSFTHKKLCDFTGWYGEETLDVEAVHAMAPDAKVHYYGGRSCLDSDIDDAVAQVVSDNKADLVSNSYGDLGEAVPAEEVQEFEAIVLQGESQGISFMFSSGDSGDEVANTGTKQPDFSASDPFVTAVGGTSTAIGAANSILFQTGWGTDKYSLSANGKQWTPNGFLYGAGGGFSSLFNRPSYQDGVVPASAPPGRAVPDVAMNADPNTGMLIGETQAFPDGNHYGEFRLGGTSLASPLFTGMQALAQQTTGRQGFLNPALYSAAKAGKAPFIDVRPVHTGDGVVRPDYVNSLDASDGITYSVRTFNQDSSLTTTRGWDDVTGIGVPSPAYVGG